MQKTKFQTTATTRHHHRRPGSSLHPSPVIIALIIYGHLSAQPCLHQMKKTFTTNGYERGDVRHSRLRKKYCRPHCNGRLSVSTHNHLFYSTINNVYLFITILVCDGIGIRVGRSGSSNTAHCFIILVRSSRHLRIDPRLAWHHHHLALIFPHLLLALILIVRPTFHTLTEKV